MKRLISKLTYANVISTLCLFLLLGGGAALAAGKVGKNTVGTKQLKANAVTAVKIKNAAVTAAKIQNGAITGAKVDLGTIGTVPSATKAASATTADKATTAINATNATNATNANNADEVNGRTITKVFTKIAMGTTATVGTFGNFSITAECSAAGDVENFQLNSQVADVDMLQQGNGNVGPTFEFESGGKPLVLDSGNNDNDRGVVTFSAAESNGTVVTGTLAYEDPSAFPGESVCAIHGMVIS
jgi:hypothetical protein